MGTTASPNIMAGAVFTLLGTRLEAGCLKDDQQTLIFLQQDIAAKNEGVTIAEMVSDVKRLLGLEKDAPTPPELADDKINAQLAPLSKAGSIDVSAIRVVLSTVYLKIRIPTDASKPKTAEYAFRVDVKMTGFIPADIKLINIESLSLAVWNTDDPAVKKQLNLLTAT